MKNGNAVAELPGQSKEKSRGGGVLSPPWEYTRDREPNYIFVF